MRIGYFIRDYVFKDSSGKLAMSGGVKMFSQHVRILKEIGFEAFVIARRAGEGVDWESLDVYEKPVMIQDDDLGDIPDCDIYVGTVFSDVKRLFERGKGKVVHFCQGYEPVDYMSRITREALTEKYQRKGIFSALNRYRDVARFKKKIREIESIYALPTVKAAASKHIAELLEKRYRQKCVLIRYGIDGHIFHPNEGRIWGKDGKIRILSVGPTQVGFKGIPDTLQAVRILKEKGHPVELVRVSPQPPSREEEERTLVDQYYINLNEREIGEMYRSSDIFISSSLEGEGFGLPAMEALASGVPSVLTEISSYKNFDEDGNFAYFVPTHKPDRIAEGVLAFMADQSLRARCIERGLKVAKGFSLERTREDLSHFMKGLIP
jgi:glycosyltransferase involved in cell wall biosynthesis